MTDSYDEIGTGRVEMNPSDAGRVGDPRVAAANGALWTFEMVQESMVEAVQLWWRMPGGGRYPYAKDGPWEMYCRVEWGDWADPDARPRLPPLTRADVARMQAAAEWLLWVPERDRRLVALALRALAGGAAQVPWMALRRPMGVRLGADGLRMRYGRAMTFIVRRLNKSGVGPGTVVNG